MNTNNENTSKNVAANKVIYNISPFTLLDYPEKTACIFWFAGCNMRCLYCYNPEIVYGKGSITYEQALIFLKSRRGLLDAVVLSGGECSLHQHLPEFITEIKRLGFLVKMDTNGSKPGLLRYLSQKGLLDYVALDFKAPKHKFKSLTTSDLYLHFRESLRVLVNSGIRFEVRTTIHSELLNQNDVDEMMEVLNAEGYQGTYYLQHFRNGSDTLIELPESKPDYLHKVIGKQDINVRFRG
ncbi:MAG: anaerobic ribonucleoside-triphosphate reductase activating protein [Bacteroidia bacterium]|nr:anaerobic ribonucleoside-triphosphate reductase activating protein [Bacteroidia bacterium]